MPSARATACVRGAEPITNQVMTMMSTAPIASVDDQEEQGRAFARSGRVFRSRRSMFASLNQFVLARIVMDEANAAYVADRAGTDLSGRPQSDEF